MAFSSPFFLRKPPNLKIAHVHFHEIILFIYQNSEQLGIIVVDDTKTYFLSQLKSIDRYSMYG